jgi:hypothetical protein
LATLVANYNGSVDWPRRGRQANFAVYQREVLNHVFQGVVSIKIMAVLLQPERFRNYLNWPGMMALGYVSREMEKNIGFDSELMLTSMV